MALKFTFSGASLLTVVSSASVLAQPHFEEVSLQRSMSFVNEYGSTFTFTGGIFTPSTLELMQRNMGNGIAVGDMDADGDLDVYVLGMLNKPNRLFRNDLETGTPGFTDVTAASGLANVGFGRLAHFADFDNDGIRDLVLVNDSDESGLHPASALFAGNGDGTFVDVTAGSGFAPTGLIKGGCAVVDYDGDGLLDLYITTWCASGTTTTCSYPGHNRLYRNMGAFTFEDVTVASGLGPIAEDSFTPIFADFDNDGDPDLFIAIDHTPDFMFRNDGGLFVDVTTETSMTHTGNDMGVTVADYDNDGDLDVYCSNITDGGGFFGTTAYNTLHTNLVSNTGEFRFIDLAQVLGVHDTFWGWGTTFVDVDNDADLDLFTVTGFDEFVMPPIPSEVYETPSVLFIKEGASYTRSTGNGADVVSDARALVAFDYDRDGDMDFLVNNVDEPIALFENQTPASGNWLSVRVRGGCGVNTEGIGTRVTLEFGEDQMRMQEVISSQSYLAGFPAELHFGLASAQAVTALHVRWPNGDTETYEDLPVNAAIYLSHASTGDVNVDGLVDFADLNRLLADWGRGASPADFDHDGSVTFSDLNELLANWGHRCIP